MNLLEPYLRILVQRNGSDILLTTGAPVSMKIEGTLEKLDDNVLQPGTVRHIAYDLISEAQQKEFEQRRELNHSFNVAGLGRFRANFLVQRSEVSLAIRYVRGDIPDVERLGLPKYVNEFVMRRNGLIFVTGSTGSGKSTTLAALIEHRNKNDAGHILTIEDPIEFMFSHKKSIVTQREVGSDTLTYENALKEALRAAPDVIMIGEVRDRPGVERCMTYAASGHTVLTTLHATNANQTLDRILNLFPADQHPNVLLQVSINLHAIISQRLVRGVDGRRVLVAEILVNTPYVAELISKGELTKIKDLMEKGETSGMFSFDQSLLELYRAGRISHEAVLANADSPTNVQWRLSFGADAPPSDGSHMA